MIDPATDSLLLEFRTELRAPPATVFATLTESAGLVRWFCDEAESEPVPGGRVLFRWHRANSSRQPFEGRWVVFRAPFSCAFEGGHSGYPGGSGGRVGFELAPHGEGTVLITRHRLPARPDYEPIATVYRGAWPRALARLAGCLPPAGGSPSA